MPLLTPAVYSPVSYTHLDVYKRQVFGMDPQVAFLSYSTLGSGKGEDVDKMRNAANKAKAKYPELPIEGELQFDAAVSPRVARTKCKDSAVAGHANTFIFPDINAGNIGYKIAQRMGCLLYASQLSIRKQVLLLYLLVKE